jgi:hypothetical protein
MRICFLPQVQPEQVWFSPLKISGGKQDRRSPHSLHPATIQRSGFVIAGADMFSPRTLHFTMNSQIRVWAQRTRMARKISGDWPPEKREDKPDREESPHCI